MESEFNFYCKNTKRKAKQVYKPVGWSGDHLAFCDACNQSPWEGEGFTKNHKKIIKTKG